MRFQIACDERLHLTGTGRLRASLGSTKGGGSEVAGGLLAENHACMSWAGGRKV